jgi:TatD DNase family protein
MWIDSHCHLDASQFDADRDAVRQAAKRMDIGLCVIPAVEKANFFKVQELAHRYQDVYALGIHPLYVPHANEDDLVFLEIQVQALLTDARLVAVGEIGLDFFVPELCTPEMRERQWCFYLAQLKIAKKHNSPVILHVRKSADELLKGLRQLKWDKGGIAHAFNGSMQQAKAFIDLGFKLGFGGTLTYERSLQIRRLATELPLESIVLETDAPDIAPQWLYVTQEQRMAGMRTQRNTPCELPKIGAVLAELRNTSIEAIATQTSQNLRAVLGLA